MLVPHPEQRHAVVDLRRLPQAPAGLSAAPLLQALEDARMIARRGPKIPRNHAGGVPDGFPVRAAIPKVDVPAEPVDQLAADAAESRSTRIAPLAIGCRRSPETCRQPIR